MHSALATFSRVPSADRQALEDKEPDKFCCCAAYGARFAGAAIAASIAAPPQLEGAFVHCPVWCANV